jgi:hypothetical protein
MPCWVCVTLTDFEHNAAAADPPDLPGLLSLSRRLAPE